MKCGGLDRLAMSPSLWLGNPADGYGPAITTSYICILIEQIINERTLGRQVWLPLGRTARQVPRTVGQSHHCHPREDIRA